MGNTKNISVGVIGARGYTGAETVKILSNHPNVSRVIAFTTEKETSGMLSDFIPSLRKIADVEIQTFKKEKVEGLDVLFLCLSHGKSHEIVAEILKCSNPPSVIIDLSADFRFSDVKTYEEIYGVKHSVLRKEENNKKKENRQIVYGLTELTRDRIKDAEIIGNPGCYPTAFLLGVAPLFFVEGMKNNVELFIIDAKSGVTGAGRKALPHLTFGYLSENLMVYSWKEHRHVPEIQEKLGEFFGAQAETYFTAQLIPAKRGILETIWIRFKSPPDRKSVFESYEKFSHQNHFFDFWGDKLPDISSAVGTNFIRVGIKIDGKTAMVVSSIDNLVKGAAGQAVQNMNVKFGFDEGAGLTDLSPYST